MDKENNIFLGVCNYLGYKTNLDPWVYRLLFVFFIGANSFILYLILYLLFSKDIDNEAT